MSKTTKNWVIVIVVIVVLIVIIGLYAAKAAPKPPTVIAGQQQPQKTNWIDLIGQVVGKVFPKKTGYTQVPPIDDQGCDANGYNAIGVKCDVF